MAKSKAKFSAVAIDDLNDVQKRCLDCNTVESITPAFSYSTISTDITSTTWSRIPSFPHLVCQGWILRFRTALPHWRRCTTIFPQLIQLVWLKVSRRGFLDKTVQKIDCIQYYPQIYFSYYTLPQKSEGWRAAERSCWQGYCQAMDPVTVSLTRFTYCWSQTVW